MAEDAAGIFTGKGWTGRSAHRRCVWKGEHSNATFGHVLPRGRLRAAVEQGLSGAYSRKSPCLREPGHRGDKGLPSEVSAIRRQ